MTSSGQGEAGRSGSAKTSREALFFHSIIVFIVFIFCIEVVLFNDLDIYNEANKMLTHSDWFQQRTFGDNCYHMKLPGHLLPHIPILPLFNSISDADNRIAALLDGQASIAGVAALLQKFISDLHDSNMKASKTDAEAQVVLDNFFRLAEKHIKPFDDVYNGKRIFPLREDDSIFISLAAFRESLLVETLVSAFKNAKNPKKLFVGAVVQNCFGNFSEDGTLGTKGKPCRTGMMTVGKDPKGKDIRKMLEAPVDKNGIEIFCAMPDYKRYCDNGQIRVVYLHHTDGQGPSMARYYASKLYGGENFFMQIDSHLRFAHEWDAKYITDAKLTLNYPKSVLSAYPPGFEQIRFIPRDMKIDRSKINNETVIESPGCRLCHCGTPPGTNPILHISQSKNYIGNETRPAQTPFLGAGLVFAHGDLLKDIPFDPYLPWTFMGEEILLSIRAWTHGWNIYAPRKNLVIHQYKSAKLGIPKFYGSISTMFKKKFGNGWFQKRMIRRIKNLCGYPLHTAEKLEADDLNYLLADIERYGLGSTRSWEDFMEFSQIKINNTNGNLYCTKRLDWCVDGSLE